ncbi:unnamed protein product [Camellia sinensis]
MATIVLARLIYKRYAYYTLKFFENNSSRLPKWCSDADTMKHPFCQIRGKYQMDPYPHMNER